MAFDSPVTSYSDTTPQKRVITDVISLIDPTAAVVVETLGGLDGASGKFRFTAKGTKYEWLEDTMPALADALNGSITSTATTITVDDASLFKPGHTILVDSEYMWVSAAAIATEILTVTRNFGGTQATHADNAVVSIVSEARLEGADSDPLAFTDRTAPYNYTQIFHYEVEVTGTQQNVEQYGINDEITYQVNKGIPHEMRLINRTAYHGQRKVGSETTPRAMGGFGTFITNNTVSAGGAVTQADFQNALKAAWEDGGEGPWNAYMTSTNKQVIAAFYDNSAFLRVDRQEGTVGMVIDTIHTDWGDVNLIMDRHAVSDKIWIVDPKHAGFVTFRPFAWDPLAKTGDKDTSEVVGEFTFCVRNDKAHALISAIS